MVPLIWVAFWGWFLYAVHDLFLSQLCLRCFRIVRIMWHILVCIYPQIIKLGGITVVKSAEGLG